MNPQRRRWFAALGIGVVLGLGGSIWWHQHPVHTYLDGDTTAFAAMFAPPPARDSAITRRELDELLELQKARTPAQVEAARADRKTEIARFLPALGLDADAPV